MNGLNYLVTRGLDRSAPEFQIVKPLLHAMCLKREEEATITKGQGDNMGVTLPVTGLLRQPRRCHVGAANCLDLLYLEKLLIPDDLAEMREGHKES